MKKIQTRLNKLSKRQLQEICKRMGIKCPKRKRDIVNKLLQPLEVKYKMWECMGDDTCEGEDKYSDKYELLKKINSRVFKIKKKTPSI